MDGGVVAAGTIRAATTSTGIATLIIFRQQPLQIMGFLLTTLLGPRNLTALLLAL